MKLFQNPTVRKFIFYALLIFLFLFLFHNNFLLRNDIDSLERKLHDVENLESKIDSLKFDVEQLYYPALKDKIELLESELKSKFDTDISTLTELLFGEKDLSSTRYHYNNLAQRILAIERKIEFIEIDIMSLRQRIN